MAGKSARAAAQAKIGSGTATQKLLLKFTSHDPFQSGVQT
jgi:hypothetical protein